MYQVCEVNIIKYLNPNARVIVRSLSITHHSSNFKEFLIQLSIATNNKR
jgi:hypothetical protein